MEPFPESYIRKMADTSTLAILDLWKKLSKEILDYGIEVVICDRKDNPQLKHVLGELNTACPGLYDGKIVLSIWLENPKTFNPLLITHEIGHWILMLNGFKGLVNKYNIQEGLDINMNSLAHHVPLYKLQRDFGHDPQKVIDSRARNNINNLSKTSEILLGDRWAEFALLFADDILNCSEDIKSDILEIINEEYPVTFSFLEKILNLVSRHDLNSPKSNLAFLKDLVNRIYLGDGWKVIDEVMELKEIIKEHNEKK